MIANALPPPPGAEGADLRCSHAHTLTLSHPQTLTLSLSHILTLTPSHSHTLTHSHTHTLTHAHTHTLTPSQRARRQALEARIDEIETQVPKP